uniref:Zinc fingers and homeoboxes protein 1 n=1 Tax=Erpetoichthys calabaricus TaxID=27687 RepID=A0A8C4SU44_ERPCA
MASKRKSTTPCMVLPTDAIEQDPDLEINSDVEEIPEAVTEPPVESIPVSAGSVSSDDVHDSETILDSTDGKKLEGGYECKYCSFQTTNLNLFTFHVDSEHPNVVLNSSYVCVECDFFTKRYDALSDHNLRYHHGEDNFKLTMVKRNNQTIFEQTLNDLMFDGNFIQQENEENEDAMANKVEPKKIAVPHKATDEIQSKDESEPELESKDKASISVPALSPVNIPTPAPVPVANPPPAPTPVFLPAGLAQVLSALQSQQVPRTQVLIPVSSIPTYNSAMDNNALLVSTYNKFPYPTVPEIMNLSAQTKYAEEQIKIWFSAQRLKHGVSWTPEEVDEARRKQFNGTVHTVPQTITVIPAHLSATTNGLQPILQTCQIVGQPGIVLTQVGGAAPLPVPTPLTLTVAGVPNQAQLPKSTVQTAHTTVETKRATPSSSLSPEQCGLRNKKSKEQLAELKNSYLKQHFPSDSEILRLMKLTGLTKGEIKKWFSDTRYNQRNSKNNHVLGLGDNTTIVIDSSDETVESPPSGPAKETRRPSWDHFSDITLQKFKEKTPEQLEVLEESYQKSSTPTDEELSRLRSETKLTRREIDAWFTEKRKAPEVPETKSDKKESESAKSVITPIKVETPTPPTTGRSRYSRDKIGKKTPEQLHILKSAFVRTQWPSAEEYDKLAEDTGLPRAYIVSWFGDTRYAWKNGNLKWYYYYQSGNIGAINGSGYRRRGRGRSRSRGRGRCRGRPRGMKRPATWSRSPPAIRFKTGKEILKEYYLKHRFLNEQDLDELVAKSKMGYEQVRDWFAEVQQKEEMGADPFETSGGGDEDDDETDDSDTWEPPRHVKRRLSKSDD